MTHDKIAREAREDAFDWDAHNRELEEALVRWFAAEVELSQAHIDMARDVRALIEDTIQ